MTGGPVRSRTVLDPYVPERGDARYTVTHYDLDLDYRVSSNRLAGRAVLEVVALEDTCDLDLDLVRLRVTKVTVDGQAVKHSHRRDRLRLLLSRPLAAGDRATVAIGYSGSPAPAKSRWGDVGWEELDDGVLVASQPSGAATWFPCNDHPSDKATFRIAVECDSPYLVVATGTLASTRVRGSRTRRVFEQQHPMATYLACLHVGQYSRFTLSETPVRQEVVLPPPLMTPVRTDLERQPRMLDLFENAFGPYPFDAYTVVVTPDELEMPLEAQGMATFGSDWLTGRRLHERLVAHELAHQWFGNSLTVAAWQDIWLNEGFACYAEWLWFERGDGVPVSESTRFHWSRLRSLPQDIVLADPGPDRMFDDRVYKRGALALHAIRLHLGDETFFALLRAWVTAHTHGSVTTEDFVAHVLAHGDPEQLGRLLHAWVWEAPLPDLLCP